MFRQKIPINCQAHFPPKIQEKYHINFSSVVAIVTLRALIFLQNGSGTSL